MFVSMRYVKTNSGSLKISVSSQMNNLSIYFKCILVLIYVSYSIKTLLERDVYAICCFVLWFSQRCVTNNCF